MFLEASNTGKKKKKHYAKAKKKKNGVNVSCCVRKGWGAPDKKNQEKVTNKYENKTRKRMKKKKKGVRDIEKERLTLQKRH